MTSQAPEPGPDGEQPSGGEPSFGWAPGSEDIGPAPAGGAASPNGAAGTAGTAGAAGGAGLDWQALLEALAAGGYLDGREEDQDAELADELAAAEDGRMGPPMPLGQVAALAVEYMPAGPAMAVWLEIATQAIASLDENCLAAVAIASRALTSRAQAGELAAVAQIAARAAEADPEIGVQDDGRPSRLCRDALGQVSLALALTDYGASAWAHLAITLTWRLPATGAALARGVINLARARVIVEATSVLGEDAARAVEAIVLPGAGTATTAQLRNRVRRAVVAVDPEGAEQRRKDAERRAQVCLYGDENGTATLTGFGLPAILAAAAMARITAIARAMKAAGQAGGLDLYRAQVMLGLLLGTLPYIPPADGAPPDQPPPDQAPPNQALPDEPPPAQPPPGEPPGPPAGSEPPPGPPAGGVQPAGQAPRGDAGPGPDDLPAPRDEDAPPDDGLDAASGADDAGTFWDGDTGYDDHRAAAGPVQPWPGLGVIPPALARPVGEPAGRPVPGLLDVTPPWTTLAGLPGGAPGTLGRIGPITPAQARQLAWAARADPASQWRIVVTNPAGQAIAVTRIRRRTRAGPGPPGNGLVGRITLIISQGTVREQGPGGPGGGDRPGGQDRPDGLAATTLQAAARALEVALAEADADAAAGGCAHVGESPAYRPPPRLREFVAARDVTCRFRTCGQPAWRADLDHTIPYDQGGRTCKCDLGGGCRKHHILKQNRRWKLEQTRPGMFTWTTPAGRTYTVGPDIYAA